MELNFIKNDKHDWEAEFEATGLQSPQDFIRKRTYTFI